MISNTEHSRSAAWHTPKHPETLCLRCRFLQNDNRIKREAPQRGGWVAKVKGKGQAAILSNAQIDQVIDLCAEPYNLVIAIAAYTGCRMGEALALKAENLNLSGGVITLTHTKTGKAREVVLHPDLVALLSDTALPTDGYLFPSPRTAGHLTRQAVDKELRQVCEALELKGVGTHSFRRSLATNLHGKNVPLKTIASITGHESLNSLAIYLDVTPAQQREAILAR